MKILNKILHNRKFLHILALAALGVFVYSFFFFPAELRPQNNLLVALIMFPTLICAEALMDEPEDKDKKH